MAIVNHAKKEINAKIVYYGPVGCGKRTALTYIYSRIKPSLRGDLKKLSAGGDALQLFDFSPFEAPLSNGYRVRLHVYTLTGVVVNPATWKMTLKGADGIVIMINPAPEQAADAMTSVAQLRDLLSAYGVGLHETPAIVQLNTFNQSVGSERAAQVAANLDLSSLVTCHSDAANGTGVLEALTTLFKQVLDRITATVSPSETAAPAANRHENDVVVPPQYAVPEVFTEQPYQGDNLQVAVLSEGVVATEGTIRIPVLISQGAVSRTLVVTVNAAFE
ncbi:MAG: hypothetical protein PHY09_12555 [Desulfuromonadaceae bacterium]|nr:hypothetical protein [Desulfuromonadaceae bacterium]MDD5107389.1 hypothetical protein [Desulfuromonadaceae bacterium]